MILLASLVHAGVVIWDGETDDKGWMEPKNWDGDVVPAANDDVVIPKDFTVVLASSTTIQSLSLEGNLVVESNATLGVFVGVPNGVTIRNAGFLDVEGTLNISLVERYGMQLLGQGSLKVSGTLNISEGENVGLFVSSISSNVDIGVFGEVAINQFPVGLLNIGDFVNQGDITISQPTITTGLIRGLYLADGSFTNSLQGVVTVNDFDIGIENKALMMNSGDISINGSRSIGVSNDNNLTNSGVISINGQAGRGLFNDSGTSIGVIRNEESGMISITGFPGIVSDCVEVIDGAILNDGAMTIFNFAGRGIMTRGFGCFTNSGFLTIDTQNCGLVIGNSSQFINSTTGIIEISIAHSPEIISNTGIFRNVGMLQISASSTDLLLDISTDSSIYFNSGTTTIGVLGMIHGVRVSDSGSFFNAGTFTLSCDFLTGNAMEARTLGFIINSRSGQMEVEVGANAAGELLMIDAGVTMDVDGEFTVSKN